MLPKVQNAFGGFDEGVAEVFAIDPIAAVNSAGRALDQTPEADRNAEQVEFYVRSDISYPAGVDPRPKVADAGNLPDVLTYRGRNPTEGETSGSPRSRTTCSRAMST